MDACECHEFLYTAYTYRRQKLCLEQMKCADVHFNVWQLKKAIAKWKGVFDNAEL